MTRNIVFVLPENEEEIKALKSFLQSRKIAFEVSEPDVQYEAEKAHSDPSGKLPVNEQDVQLMRERLQKSDRKDFKTWKEVKRGIKVK